ncbi:MAG: flippase-like domain-containing protein [Pseudomonadaceae bacterium]|nr:flippase-like domain-containing protein [Pseudomonadaceae bacterium]
MSWRQALRVGGSLLVSGFFVVMVLRLAPLVEIGDAMATVQPEWLLVAVGLFGLDYACRIARWRRMLLTENRRLGWGRCMVPFMVSIAANNVLPLRTGDVLRVVGFSGWLGVPTVSLLATLLVERLLDVLVLLAALGLALGLLQVETSGVALLANWGGSVLVTMAGVVLAVLVFPAVFALLARGCVAVVGRVAPGVAARLDVAVARVFGILGALAKRHVLVPLLGWSVAVWALEASVFYAVARGIPAIANPMAAWLAMPVGTLSTLLPSTPGYVGTFHYFVAQSSQLVGNPLAASAAFAVVVHLVLWLCATLWGGMCFMYWVWVRQPPFSKKDSAA